MQNNVKLQLKTTLFLFLLITLTILLTGCTNVANGNYYIYNAVNTPLVGYENLSDALGISADSFYSGQEVDRGPTIVKVTSAEENSIDNNGQVVGGYTQVKLLEGEKAGKKLWITSTFLHIRGKGDKEEETAFPENQKPVARMEIEKTVWDITNDSEPAKVKFKAKSSYDLDGRIVKYQWNFDGGRSKTGEKVALEFETKDKYKAELTVTDDEGETTTISEKFRPSV